MRLKLPGEAFVVIGLTVIMAVVLTLREDSARLPRPRKPGRRRKG